MNGLQSKWLVAALLVITSPIASAQCPSCEQQPTLDCRINFDGTSVTLPLISARPKSGVFRISNGAGPSVIVLTRC
jgi:hypothetical protein